MARVTDNNHFAEGWQKSKANYSESIHQQGNSARQIQQGQEKASANAREAQNKVHTPEPSQASKISVTTPDHIKTPANQQIETQNKVADLQARADAASQCVAAKSNAQALNHLTTKAQPLTQVSPATNNPVVGAQLSTQQQVPSHQPQVPANVVVQQQPKAPVVADKARSAVSSRTPQKGAELQEAKDVATARDAAPSAAAEPMASTAKGVNAAAVKGGEKVDAATTDVAFEGEEVEAEEQDDTPGSSRFAHGPTQGKGASRDLNAMLGGFSGGSDQHDEHDGQALDAAAGAPRDAAALPETDPHFAVYSEFDSEKPSVEFVKSRAQVYSRFVEKKLTDIAKLDAKIDTDLKQLFRDQSLSERIVGEFADDLRAAKFLGSVYGGVLG